MIGEIIESRRGFPWGAVFFLTLGAGLAAVAVPERDYHWALGASMPLLIGLALALSPTPSLSFEFTDEGLLVHEPPQTIPYAAFETVIAPGRPGDPDKRGPGSYPIQLVHEGGALHIPARLNVPSNDVFAFLLAAFPASGSPEVNPLLRGYLDRQTAEFGPERVLSYRARSRLGKATPNRGARVSLAVFLAGVGWIVNGGVKDEPVWGGFGVLAALFGGLFAILFASLGRRNAVRGVKGWRRASLVISPVGLALVQGDLQGEMRWDELRDLKFSRPTGFHQDNRTVGRGIVLHFEGARVLIADVYDRPLNLIYKQIRTYWRGPGASG